MIEKSVFSHQESWFEHVRNYIFESWHHELGFLFSKKFYVKMDNKIGVFILRNAKMIDKRVFVHQESWFEHFKNYILRTEITSWDP